MSLMKRSAYAILRSDDVVVAVDLGRVSRKLAIRRFEAFVDKYADRDLGDVRFIWVSEKNGDAWHMWAPSPDKPAQWTKTATPSVDFVAQMTMVTPADAKASLAA